MLVEKFGDPGSIAHELVLILRESVIAKVASSLKLLSTTGRARDKVQVVHLLWEADRGKYTLLLDKLSNDFLKGHNNYPKIVSEACSLLIL